MSFCLQTSKICFAHHDVVDTAWFQEKIFLKTKSSDEDIVLCRRIKKLDSIIITDWGQHTSTDDICFAAPVLLLKIFLKKALNIWKCAAIYLLKDSWIYQLKYLLRTFLWWWDEFDWSAVKEWENTHWRSCLSRKNINKNNTAFQISKFQNSAFWNSVKDL